MWCMGDERINGDESVSRDAVAGGAGVDPSAGAASSAGVPSGAPDRGVAGSVGSERSVMDVGADRSVVGDAGVYLPVPPQYVGGQGQPLSVQGVSSEAYQRSYVQSGQVPQVSYLGERGYYPPSPSSSPSGVASSSQYPSSSSPYSQGAPVDGQSGQGVRSDYEGVSQGAYPPPAASYYPPVAGGYPATGAYPPPDQDAYQQQAPGAYPPPAGVYPSSGVYAPPPAGQYPASPVGSYAPSPAGEPMSRKAAKRAAKAARAAQDIQVAGGVQSGQGAGKKSRKGLIALLSVLAVLVVAAALVLVWWFVLKPDAGGSGVVAGLAREPRVQSITASQGADDSTVSEVDGIVVYSSESAHEVWAVDAVRDKELWRSSARDLGCSGEVGLSSVGGDYVRVDCQIDNAGDADYQYVFVNVRTGESAGELRDGSPWEIGLLGGGQGRVVQKTEHSITLYSDPTMKEKVWERAEEGCSSGFYERSGYINLSCYAHKTYKTLLLRADSGESIEWAEEFMARSDFSGAADAEYYDVWPVSADRFLVSVSKSHGEIPITGMLGVRDVTGKKLWEKQIAAVIVFADDRYIVLNETGGEDWGKWTTKVLSTETGEEVDIPIGDLSGPPFGDAYSWDQGLITITYTENGSKGTLAAYSPQGKVWSITPKQLTIDTSKVRYGSEVIASGHHLYTMRLADERHGYTIVDSIVLDK